MENIGLQLYSVRELTQKDFAGTLKQIAEIGFHGVEFAGYFGTPAPELAKILTGLGLRPAGSHIGIASLRDDLDRVLEYSLCIKDPYVICPALPPDMRDSADAYKRTAELLNKIGRKCLASGIRLGYHNHDFEFESYEGKLGLDILLENTQPDLLFLELDTFWAEYCGLKSVDFIHRYGERCSILHIKDMKSRDNRINTEIGNGIMDFAEITSAGKENRTEWFTIEQEEFEKPVLQSIREGFEYLRGIL